MICSCGHNDHYFDRISAIDYLIAKAVSNDELIQAAKIEKNLHTYINRQWDTISIDAAKEAANIIKRGKSEEITDTEIDRMLKKIASVMSEWPKAIKKRFTKETERIYELAHMAARKRAYGVRKKPMTFDPGTFVTKQEIRVTPDLEFADAKAMDVLNDHQIFWIGEHYENNVSPYIAKTTQRQILELGRNRTAAGKVMERVVRLALKEARVPGGFNGTNEKYFEGLVANAATSVRSTTQLREFSKVGYTVIEVINPMDHRTCERCQYLDGKQFYISEAQSQLDNILGAKNPTAIKTIQPWRSVNEIKSLAGRTGKVTPRGTRNLSGANVIMPPFHYLCRCNLDVTQEEIESILPNLS